MQLPNFLGDAGLLELRRRMRADVLGDLELKPSANTLTKEELDGLAGGGLDVTWEQVSVLDDGTLAYKNTRVVLYIRDIKLFRNQAEPDRMSRYHVAYCQTLKEMLRKDRIGHYVVATRTDGLFSVNFVRSDGTHRHSEEALAVCQNCLAAMRFDDFHYGLETAERKQIVASFTLQRFFELYPHSVLRRDGHDEDVTAPLNQYSRDFPEIAAALKKERGFCCSECHLDLNDAADRRYLHVHHVNGLKYDNRLSNLQLVCLGCHSEQPNHEHMRRGPEYREFMRRFPDRRRVRR